MSIFDLQADDEALSTDDSSITTTEEPEYIQEIIQKVERLSNHIGTLDNDFNAYKKDSLIGIGCMAAVIIVLFFVIVFLVFWIRRLQRLVRSIDPLSRYKKVRPSTFIRPRERQETPSFGNKHLGKYDSGNTYSETYDNNNANRNNNDPYETPTTAPQSAKGRPAAPVPNNPDRTSLDNLNFSNWNPLPRPTANPQPSFLNPQRPPANLVKRNPSSPQGAPYNNMGNQYY